MVAGRSRGGRLASEALMRYCSANYSYPGLHMHRWHPLPRLTSKRLRRCGQPQMRCLGPRLKWAHSATLAWNRLQLQQRCTRDSQACGPNVRLVPPVSLPAGRVDTGYQHVP